MKTLLACLALALAGCTSLESSLRKVPPVEFKSWSHSDRYGMFTDSLVLGGAKWTLNPDGSATLTLDHYDGNAAWAGSVGPHDVIEGLVVHFAKDTPQAQALAAAIAGK